jgi:hypothetical protein
MIYASRRLLGAAIIFVVVLQLPLVRPHAALVHADGGPALEREEVVATDGATGDGGDGWGAHKLRIVRASDGTVYTTYLTPGSDYTHKNWVLARRTDSGWQTVADGVAGREPVNLLRGPDDELTVLSWPDQAPAMWSSATDTETPVPGAWSETDWPYSAAGISPGGDIYLLEDICSCTGSTPNSPGLYGVATRLASSGQWQFSTFNSDYRYAYMFLMPQSDGSLSLTGTRGVLWSELGYTQPPGAFGYVFNAVRQWSLDGDQASAPTLIREEQPTGAGQMVIADATDVYVDTAGRTHVLYSLEGSDTGGLYKGRHAILQNGVVISDVPNPVMYPNLSRIIQDSSGRFTIFSVCGSTVTIASGLPGDTDGTRLGAPVTLQLRGSYDCNQENNNYIAAPRGGTPLADYVDGAFDVGPEWVYYRLRLPGTGAGTALRVNKPAQTAALAAARIAAPGAPAGVGAALARLARATAPPPADRAAFSAMPMDRRRFAVAA